MKADTRLPTIRLYSIKGCSISRPLDPRGTRTRTKGLARSQAQMALHRGTAPARETTSQLGRRRADESEPVSSLKVEQAAGSRAESTSNEQQLRAVKTLELNGTSNLEQQTSDSECETESNNNKQQETGQNLVNPPTKNTTINTKTTTPIAKGNWIDNLLFAAKSGRRHHQREPKTASTNEPKETSSPIAREDQQEESSNNNNINNNNCQDSGSRQNEFDLVNDQCNSHDDAKAINVKFQDSCPINSVIQPEQQTTSKNSSPEFWSSGELRQKLRRFPYFTHKGRAPNVTVLRVDSRGTIASSNKNRDQEPTGHSSQESLQEQANGKTTTRSRSELLQKRAYSNISNLFPDKPMPSGRATRPNNNRQFFNHQTSSKYSTVSETDTRPSSSNDRNKSNRQITRSLLNLNQLVEARARHHNNNSKSKQPPNSDSRNSTSSSGRSAMMRRHNSMLGGQVQPGSGSHFAAATPTGVAAPDRGPAAGGQAAGPKGSLGARPASVSGNYGLALAGGRAQRRSPSASSLHYGPGGNHQAGAAADALYLPYESRQLQQQDPDCPVHGGLSTYELEKAGEPGLGSPGGGLGDADSPYGYPAYGARRRGPSYYGDSKPLGDRAGRQTAYSSAYSLYSPTSPIDRAPAYYEQTRGGDRAPYGTGGIYGGSRDRGSGHLDQSAGYSKSALSGSRSLISHQGPKEPLRRMLGYPGPSKPVHLHPQWAYSRPFHHLLPSGAEWTSHSPLEGQSPDGYIDYDDEINQMNASLLRFSPFNRLEDTQAIRAVDFHPSGQVYAIGSNSRALRICAYPAPSELSSFGASLLMDSPTSGNHSSILPHHNNPPQSPRVLFKFLQVHRGSIYCVRFNKTGQLLATGSNDQTVHIVRYNSRTHSPEGDEYRLTMHDGTIRDLCFIDDSTSGNSLLLSAGGGDNKIYVTDCDTITPFQSFAGHTGMVMGLHHLGGAQFVSGSQDRTIRFWDLRTRQCTSIVSAPPARPGTRWAGGPGAPVCAVQADHSGRLLVSGHTDSTCMLYDTRGARIIQAFKPHEDEIRTVSFSPKSYYLLTGAYDGRIVLSDLQGDLNQPLPSVCVAESDDKIIQSRWHPSDFTFVTTSANKTATLWVPPSDGR